MSEDKSPQSAAPDSLQKGLLQILWTTRPWIRNVVLVIVGVLVFFVTLVPQDLRSDLLRRLFNAESNKQPSIARPALDGENTHVSRLKNGHLLRFVGSIVSNRSNVSDNIVRDAVEFDAWRYNHYCYDGSFGHLKTPLPAGTVTVEFDVLDQLPQNAKLGASDFGSNGFGDCVVKILMGQTINAAGPDGKGHVAYAFKFLPD